MFRLKPVTLIFTAFTLLSAGMIFAETMDLGGTAGWMNLHRTSGLTMAPGAEGLQEIVLENRLPETESDTDLLLLFNGGRITELTGNYRIISDGSLPETATTDSRPAAVFRGENEKIGLVPVLPAILSGPDGGISDFTIDFWLKPSRLNEGSGVLQWRGGIILGDKVRRQEIFCGISERKLVWEFNNIFINPDLSDSSIRLSSDSLLIPDRWHHHLLRYSSRTGLLEYLVDGIPTDITHATVSGNEETGILFPIIGNAGAPRMSIGRGLTGHLGSLRISRSVLENVDLRRYSPEGGTAVSGILDLGYTNSRFEGISAEHTAPGNTAVYYYYRLSDEWFNPEADTPSWIQIEPGDLPPEQTRGRFIQFKAELYPDETASVSPSLTSLRLGFERDMPPITPGFIYAEPGDGEVVLHWEGVNEQDIGGYKVYYGTSPGYYFGTEAEQGAAPVDAGNTTQLRLSGLENGKLYFFAVTSYDKSADRHESAFSAETSARPSRIHGNR